MDGIEQLQSSHRRLQDLYNNLYTNQRDIISHELISEQDLSISSLLKFAPIAENFQSYADDYKNELMKFQSLLNTVQQTVKKINIINNPPTPLNQSTQINGNLNSNLNNNVNINNNITDDDNKTMINNNIYNNNNTIRKNASNIFYEQEEEEEEEVEQQVVQHVKVGVEVGVEVEQLEKQEKQEKQEEDINFDDFDIGDSKEIHEEHNEYQLKQNEIIKEQNEYAYSQSKKMISYSSILKKNRNKNLSYKQTYTYNNNILSDFFTGKEIYTSTMLRFSGINGLRENNENDKDLIKQIMINDIKFNEEQIENIQIRNGRSWCIVYIRCSMKFIKDKIKKQQAKNKKIYKENREIRQQQIKNNNNMSYSIQQKPIYKINEYVRRTNYNQIENEQQNENKKLYVLNFDVLNKNCHKALTNLFLKFGDLSEDIQIGINSRNDPYAKVTYKDINDAKILWEYQNINGEPKITFGKRILTIQYAKY